MQSAGQSMGQMQGKFNQPMASFMQAQGKDGSGGYLGARNGQVKLPAINDYLPPKEFREEIIAHSKIFYILLYLKAGIFFF